MKFEFYGINANLPFRTWNICYTSWGWFNWKLQPKSSNVLALNLIGQYLDGCYSDIFTRQCRPISVSGAWWDVKQMIDVKALILCCLVTCASSAIEQKRQVLKTSSLTQTDIILHERKTEVRILQMFVRVSIHSERENGLTVTVVFTWASHWSALHKDMAHFKRNDFFSGNFANHRFSTLPIFFFQFPSAPLLYWQPYHVKK